MFKKCPYCEQNNKIERECCGFCGGRLTEIIITPTYPNVIYVSRLDVYTISTINFYLCYNSYVQKVEIKIDLLKFNIVTGLSYRKDDIFKEYLYWEFNKMVDFKLEDYPNEIIELKNYDDIKLSGFIKK